MTLTSLRRRAHTVEDLLLASGSAAAKSRALTPSRLSRALRTRREEGRDGLPLSVGVDVVAVDGVASALGRFGDRYVHRVFTAREAAYCLNAAAPVAAARLAVRFAAKEAAIKVLGPDRPWSNWRTIEVLRHPSGRCALVVHGEAAALAARRGIDHFALSMSHEGDFAAAVVIALRTSPIQKRERRHAQRDHE